MLADRPVLEADASRRGSRRRARRDGGGEAGVAAAVAFAAAGALVLLYALRGGGSYDVVTFEEYGLVVWWLVAVAVALGLLPRRRPAWPMLVLLGTLAAYAGWTALSLTWTQSAELTTEELARSLDYLGLVTLLGLSLSRSTWRAASAGLGFGALLVCVVAVGSRLDPAFFGHDQIDAAYHIDRLSYPFGYWNAVAAWGAMCVALGLTWSANARSRPQRAFALALVPVAGVMTYLTYSRGGLAGTALALIAVLVVSRNRITAIVHILVAGAGTAFAVLAVRHASAIAHGTGTAGSSSVFAALLFAAGACVVVAVLTSALRVDRMRIPSPLVRPLFIAGLILVVAIGATFGPGLVSRGWHSFTRPVVAAPIKNPTARLTTLSGTRYPIWKSALADFRAHPVGGTGAGTFAFWWNQHGTNGEAVRDVHNIWLENLAELGVPGLLLIVAVSLAALGVGVLARRGARRTTSAGAAGALLAVFVVYLLHATVDWMWESTAVTVLALGAIAIAGARLSERRMRLPIPWRIVVALIAVLCGVVQLPGLLSTSEIRQSQAAERQGNAALALAWARDAVRAEPWSASAYEQEGLVLESAGRFTQARAELTNAIAHEPYNYRHWLIRARIETELGELGPAVRDYARAQELRPRAEVFSLAPYFHFARGPHAGR